MDSSKGVRAGLILLIVVLVGVLVVLGINLLPSIATLSGATDNSGPVPIRREATSDLSLSEAYDRAGERALAWSESAHLVRVEANWYVTADWKPGAMPPVAWSFLYFAAADGTLATVVVDDEQVLWVEPMAIPVEPRALVNFPPSYGPELAWLSFLGAGGETFLATHSSAQVVFKMQQLAEQAVWTIAAFEGDALTQVTVDAESGVVVGSQ